MPIHSSTMSNWGRGLVLALALASTAGLGGCIALAATGMVAGAKAAVDRRSLGAQTDDPAIEFKVFNAIQRGVRNPSGISATSYNRRVLLTGQVLDEQAKRDAEQSALGIEGVRMVFNELDVAGRTGIGSRTTDTVITTRVKAAFIDTSEMITFRYTVITENAVVYLMGLVTREEGERAARIASRVNGVQKVVTVFEYITDADAAAAK